MAKGELGMAMGGPASVAVGPDTSWISHLMRASGLPPRTVIRPVTASLV